MPLVFMFTDLTPLADEYLKFMLLINSYYITGTAVNTCLIAGIFRAGGDSKFGFWCDLIDMWAYAVPLGLLAAFVLKLPVKWVYFLLCTDEFVKWPWVFKHFYSHKWAQNITRDNVD
jgi:Na+-driven multidrug efflux pump